MSSRLTNILLLTVVVAIGVNVAVDFRMMQLLEQVSGQLAEPRPTVILAGTPQTDVTAAADDGNVPEPPASPEAPAPPVEPPAPAEAPEAPEPIAPPIDDTPTTSDAQTEQPVPPPTPDDPPATPVTATLAEPWAVSGPVVVEVITQLLDGDYEPVHQRLTDRYISQLKKLSRPDSPALESSMDKVRTKHGAFRRVIETSEGGAGLPGELWRVDVETEKGSRLTFTIKLDIQRKVESIFVRETSTE